jgi:nucleoside-diphosphate-sugar epimerase
MKEILIVGGTGFLGYHVSKALINKFKIISLSTSAPKKIRFLKKVKYYKIDISNKNLFKKIEKKLLNISYVINFGGHVDHQSKLKVFNSHYVGAKNLINFFSKKKIKVFIQIGSSMEYGLKKSPQKENFKLFPISFYGKAKLLATNYALKAYKKLKFPVIIIRPYQVYGPNQDTNRLIPFVITESLKKNIFPCSHGKQLRDFLYISDFVDCIKKIINKDIKYGQILNVGYGKPIQIKKTIDMINKKIKTGEPIFNKIKMRKEEQKIIYPNIQKIKKILNWKPKTKLNVGISKTIEFYKKNII